MDAIDLPYKSSFRSDLNEKQAAFAEFIARHGRSYASKDHAESRFEIFSENYDAIKAHNEKGTYEKGINDFADLTRKEMEERMQGHKLRVPKIDPALKSQHSLKQAALQEESFTVLPDYVSWYDQKKYVNRDID